MSAFPPIDGVSGRPSLWIVKRFWVLRFRLMVKRGPLLRPQTSEGEAQHGPFCWIGRICQGDQRRHCGGHGQDRSGSEGGERAGSFVAGAEEPRLSLQADWIGSWTAVAVAFQRSRGSRLAGDLRRDAAYAGSIKGADQQDRPQRRTRDGADDAGGTLSSGACEDAAQSETADAADPSQAAAVEGYRHRQ